MNFMEELERGVVSINKVNIQHSIKKLNETYCLIFLKFQIK
jgi:hypothetical protein